VFVYVYSFIPRISPCVWIYRPQCVQLFIHGSSVYHHIWVRICLELGRAGEGGPARGVRGECARASTREDVDMDVIMLLYHTLRL